MFFMSKIWVHVWTMQFTCGHCAAFSDVSTFDCGSKFHNTMVHEKFRVNKSTSKASGLQHNLCILCWYATLPKTWKNIILNNQEISWIIYLWNCISQVVAFMFCTLFSQHPWGRFHIETKPLSRGWVLWSAILWKKPGNQIYAIPFQVTGPCLEGYQPRFTFTMEGFQC